MIYVLCYQCTNRLYRGAQSTDLVVPREDCVTVVPDPLLTTRVPPVPYALSELPPTVAILVLL